VFVEAPAVEGGKSPKDVHVVIRETKVSSSDAGVVALGRNFEPKQYAASRSTRWELFRPSKTKILGVAIAVA
jgi:hypothetical protein